MTDSRRPCAAPCAASMRATARRNDGAQASSKSRMTDARELRCSSAMRVTRAFVGSERVTERRGFRVGMCCTRWLGESPYHLVSHKTRTLAARQPGCPQMQVSPPAMSVRTLRPVKATPCALESCPLRKRRTGRIPDLDSPTLPTAPLRPRPLASQICLAPAAAFTSSSSRQISSISRPMQSQSIPSA